MSDTQTKQERRHRQERRQTDSGPPAGVHDRRVNIERRLFNLGLDGGAAWLSAAAPAMEWNATPPGADLSVSGEARPGLAGWLLH